MALTGCARSALGLCASSSGAIAGCLTWREEGGDPIDCTTTTGGKRVRSIVYIHCGQLVYCVLNTVDDT